MPIITQKYEGKLGEIKFSKARNASHFRGKTKGLALKYVIEGAENYQLDKDQIYLFKEQFLLFKKDENYEIAFENKSNLTQGICIDLTPDIDEKLNDLYSNEFLFKTAFKSYTFSPLGKTLKNLLPELNDKKNNTKALSSISSQLISFSDEVFDMQMRLGYFAKKMATKRILVSKLMASKDFIYKNYRSKITLDHLALESGISKFHFSKLFKNCFQKSPFEIQESLRIQKAKRLILTGEMRLTDIAFYLGYSDLAAFSNQFKKHFRVPPSCFENSQDFTNS